MTKTDITLKLAKLVERANNVPEHYSSRYSQGVVAGQGVQVWMIRNVDGVAEYQVWALGLTGSKPLTISEAADLIAAA